MSGKIKSVVLKNDTARVFAMSLGASTLVIGLPFLVASVVINQKAEDALFFSQAKDLTLSKNSQKMLWYSKFLKNNNNDFKTKKSLFGYGDLDQRWYDSFFDYLTKNLDNKDIFSSDFENFLSQDFFWKSFDAYQINSRFINENEFIKDFFNKDVVKNFAEDLKIDSPFTIDNLNDIFNDINILETSIKSELKKSFVYKNDDNPTEYSAKKTNKKEILKNIFIENFYQNLLPEYFLGDNNDTFNNILEKYFNIFYDFFVEKEKSEINAVSFQNFWKKNYKINKQAILTFFSSSLNSGLEVDLETNSGEKNWYKFLVQNLKNVYGKINISELHHVFESYFSKFKFSQEVSYKEEIENEIKKEFSSLMKKYQLSKDLETDDNFSFQIFHLIWNSLKNYKTIHEFTFKNYFKIIENSIPKIIKKMYLVKTKDLFNDLDDFNEKTMNYFTFDRLKNLFETENILLEKTFIENKFFDNFKSYLFQKTLNSNKFIKNFWGSLSYLDNLFKQVFDIIFYNILLNRKEFDLKVSSKENRENEFLKIVSSFFSLWKKTEIENYFENHFQRLTNEINDIILENWTKNFPTASNLSLKNVLAKFFVSEKNAFIFIELFNRYKENDQNNVSITTLENKLKETNGFIDIFVSEIKKDFVINNNFSIQNFINVLLENNKFLFSSDTIFTRLINITDEELKLFSKHYFKVQKLETKEEKLQKFQIKLKSMFNLGKNYLLDKFIAKIYDFFDSGKFFQEVWKKNFKIKLSSGKTLDDFEFFNVYKISEWESQINSVSFDNSFKKLEILKKIKPFFFVKAFRSHEEVDAQKNAIKKVIYKFLHVKESFLSSEINEKLLVLQDKIFDHIKKNKIFLPPRNYKNNQKSFYDLLISFIDSQTIARINDIIFTTPKPFSRKTKLNQLLEFFLKKIHSKQKDIKKRDWEYINNQFQKLIIKKRHINISDFDIIIDEWFWDSTNLKPGGHYGYTFKTLQEMLLSNMDFIKFQKFISSNTVEKNGKISYEDYEKDHWKEQISIWLNLKENQLKDDSILFQFRDYFIDFIRYFFNNLNTLISTSNNNNYLEVFKDHFKDYKNFDKWYGQLDNFIFSRDEVKIEQILDFFDRYTHSKDIQKKILEFFQKSNLENNLFFTELNKSLVRVVFDHVHHLKFYKMTPILDNLIMNSRITERKMFKLGISKSKFKNISKKRKWLHNYDDFITYQTDKKALKDLFLNALINENFNDFELIASEGATIDMQNLDSITVKYLNFGNLILINLLKEIKELNIFIDNTNHLMTLKQAMKNFSEIKVVYLNLKGEFVDNDASLEDDKLYNLFYKEKKILLENLSHSSFKKLLEKNHFTVLKNHKNIVPNVAFLKKLDQQKQTYHHEELFKVFFPEFIFPISSSEDEIDYQDSLYNLVFFKKYNSINKEYENGILKKDAGKFKFTIPNLNATNEYYYLNYHEIFQKTFFVDQKWWLISNNLGNIDNIYHFLINNLSSIILKKKTGNVWKQNDDKNISDSDEYFFEYNGSELFLFDKYSTITGKQLKEIFIKLNIEASSTSGQIAIITI